jgi:hypothetical protein
MNVQAVYSNLYSSNQINTKKKKWRKSRFVAIKQFLGVTRYGALQEGSRGSDMGHYKRGPAGVIWGTTRGVPRE